MPTLWGKAGGIGSLTDEVPGATMKVTNQVRSCAYHVLGGFWRVSLSTVCWLIATSTVHASPMYTVTDLGPLAGTSQPSSSPPYDLANGYVLNTAGTLAYQFVTTPKPSAQCLT